MAKYFIPVVYQMTGSYLVEAESLEQAENLVLHQFGLPENDTSYIEDSMELDKEHSGYGDIH